MLKKLMLLVVVVSIFLIPAVTFAQEETFYEEEALATATVTPKIMLEKSESYALDNYVRAFQVPTINSTGVIRYYDVKITLVVAANGVISPQAVFTSTLSPSVKTGVIVPGTYEAEDGVTCTVTNLTLTNGRVQSFFACKDTSDRYFEFSMATGPITTGHPYLSELINAKINKLPDVNTYIWGIVTNTTNNVMVGGCGFLATDDPIGIKTNGNQLMLSLFASQQYYNLPYFLCGCTLKKK